MTVMVASAGQDTRGTPQSHRKAVPTNRVDRSPAVMIPTDNPLSSWPRSARKIIMAARGVLAEKGYKGLSYSSVARAAHVDKGTIRYNFGNKATLVVAIVDSLIHDECVALAEELEGLTGEQRVHHAVAGLRRIVLAGDAQRGWFDILPHVLREEELRVRICRLYEWWLQLNLTWLDLPNDDRENARIAAGVASLFAAIADGLALQVSLGIDIDLDASFDALELMLERTFSSSQS